MLSTERLTGDGRRNQSHEPVSRTRGHQGLVGRYMNSDQDR
jgi:hypothetical protein